MTLSSFNQEIYLVITTEFDKKNASKLANLLLREKLIPCVTFKNIESHFWWEGNINQSQEVQLMIKCKKENLDNVCNKISEFHSYSIPEIIYFRVSANKNYYHWMNSI
ncbi:divalent-cation tolerance protein CutA [Prochlorococcus marinus]|uniref:CutA1 divalent ion tolerance protein n=1 Tax=Prochlorococcus marinus str. PAC1 TaxID=59924 RepID=A0A0A2C1E4_PROMR|nr:divalent-cation tolerance protein CutA [Prochlorococcus marinus]KGG19342.1 CutA1 divalent ion tolerance protein [Prochlorococcus marinus str. PAC1]